MAPSRKKGAGKAAAAAASRRQWKVGDLVLAKVKGFPAWPATVSEPEKWGYSTDWKKVLVYFFGTQQIAFCNPADVEAFTEEKKQSLLFRRHGRGADFVRAVQEIVDSYEKLKKQDRIDSNSGDEVANGGNSVDSLAHLELKDRTESSEATLDSILKPTTAKEDPRFPAVDAPAARQLEALPDKEALLEQPTESLVVKEKPVLTTYTSRKRSGGLRSQNTQRKTSSSRRSRSSSRIESCRFQSFITPYSDDGRIAGDVSATVVRDGSARNKRSRKSADASDCDDDCRIAGDISATVVRDGSLRRNKRARKSPDALECEDVDSSAFISNGSIEDNGSEIVTVESDAFSLNEVSTMDCICKVENSETVCLEGDVELSKGLDFQINAVVNKKKRKPTRKRVASDAFDPLVSINTEAYLELGTQNASQISENSCGNVDGRHSKEDGDEHLPLVKRARVRMGKLSSAVELKSFLQSEEKPSKDATVELSERISPSSSHGDDGLADRDPSAVKESLDNISALKGCTQVSGSRPQLWKGTKNQPFGCSTDDEPALLPCKPLHRALEAKRQSFGFSPEDEAALPPSKRLHRALEAMSANAAEEGQACMETSSTINTSINELCIAPMKRCSHDTMESREQNGFGWQSVDSLDNNVSGLCSSPNPTVLEESTKSSGEARDSDQLIKSSMSQKQELCKDVEGQSVNVDGKDITVSSLAIQTIQTVVPTRSSEHISPITDGRQVSFKSDQGSLDQLLPNGKGCSENLELSNFRAQNAEELDTLQCTELSLDPVPGAGEVAIVSPQNGADGLLCDVEDTCCENSESLKSQINDNCGISDLCEVVEEIKNIESQKGASTVSVSDDHAGDKGVSEVQLSSSAIEGVDSPARVSPPDTHISTSESANIVQNNCCSPIVHSQEQRTLGFPVADEGKIGTTVPQSQGANPVEKLNSNSEAHAALSSFEAALGSLTRMKECIGRATRIAIDCAKFGVSAKVVEILARNLESEPSLHRRVDLFFLVDSIAQCSRGLKGGVDCIYPSAIQAVLPRLLSAAAPPGNIALENRRQCLKVLRLWLERRILPESVIRHHMRELDMFGCSSSAGAHSRRSSRTERALDDPIRDMEGMLVDEYGSNSSFQLPGFCMPRMLKEEDEGSDSDGGSFEAVTPEQNPETPEERDKTPAIEKHRHILEDVDGELEMEDVAPSYDIELSSTNGVACVNTSQISDDQLLLFVPPLPQDVPPSSPPLPSSPPPPPPPPPPPQFPSDPYPNGASMHNMQNDVLQSVDQQSASRVNPTIPTEAIHYHAHECRDHPMPVQVSDSNSSFGNYPSACPPTNVQQNDGPRFHHKLYPPRPPHAPPSNQFSYVQTGQNVKSRREAPPRYHSNRFHSEPSIDGGNLYNNHDRIKPAPYELRESWRFSTPSYSGPRYPDKAKESYAPGSYAGPLPNQGWAYPPRAMNHRNSLPNRPPSGGAVPVGLRGMNRF